MKFSKIKAFRSGQRGFTLVEIVAVISILGVLFAILATSVVSIQKKARKAEARALFGKLVLGVQAYYQDYGYYPALGGSMEQGDQLLDLSESEQWERFCKLFTLKSPDGSSAKEDSLVKRFNPRGKVYLNFSAKQLIEDASGACHLEDAFGNPNIVVVMDADMDGRIETASLPAEAGGALSQRVVVYTRDGGGQYPSLYSWDF